MSKTLFDHVDAICTDQRLDYYTSLEESDKKTFTPYMVNRVLSMTMDYIPVVNEVQKYTGILDNNEVYLVYSQTLPCRKTYSKYIKAEASDKYEPWLVELLANEHKVSQAEAKTYLDILYRTAKGKTALKELCDSWAIDPKLQKKAKLG